MEWSNISSEAWENGNESWKAIDVARGNMSRTICLYFNFKVGDKRH